MMVAEYFQSRNGPFLPAFHASREWGADETHPGRRLVPHSTTAVRSSLSERVEVAVSVYTHVKQFFADCVCVVCVRAAAYSLVCARYRREQAPLLGLG